MPPLEIPHFLWSTIQTACNLENPQNSPHNWSIYPGESPKSPSQLGTLGEMGIPLFGPSIPGESPSLAVSVAFPIEEEEEALEEDDLELLEENTGTSFRNRLTRLCQSRDGRSPPTSSSFRWKQVVESSEDVLDDDEDLPQVQDIQRIWDNERAGRGQEDEEEVPCTWTHKHNYISYFNPQEIRTQIDLTSLAELQRIHISGQKYHSLVEHHNALFAAYSRLNAEDDHSKQVNTKSMQLRL
ncbi:hypothetical protein BKA83DRAFT_4127766 [Pisolithus microcarpus]|nr:hypothetical protein BKA83DRAFT_4127766 [Pisolithus microcarpus]